MQIIDANPATFRKGQMMWFNLTDARVGGKLGSRELALEPNSRKTTGAPASKNEAITTGHLLPEARSGKSLAPVRNRVASRPRRSRIVMFVLPQGANRAPRIMSFSDFRLETKLELITNDGTHYQNRIYRRVALDFRR